MIFFHIYLLWDNPDFITKVTSLEYWYDLTLVFLFKKKINFFSILSFNSRLLGLEFFDFVLFFYEVILILSHISSHGLVKLTRINLFFF
jgi:hypothetical protein